MIKTNTFNGLLLSAGILTSFLGAQSLEAKDVQTAPTIRFMPSDSQEARVTKAAMVVPHARQLAWQQLEFTCFIHFGINTFTGNEWGSGMEKAKAFNPTKVDTDQWCRTAKAAGMKMMLITMKHHDGYCLWQTRYNDDFSVKQSPWKDGKGDVLKLLTKSCKKFGLKLGVYLSPADLYQLESKTGLYGNGSEYKDSIIPTDPASFKSNPMKARKVPAGQPTFKFKLDDYNRYMLNQLYECMTEYGSIDEIWFDGAHPKSKGNQKYTKAFWQEMIYALNPKATIAIGGPDVRWCGNEHGGSRRAEWSAMPLKGDPTARPTWKLNGATWGGQDLASRSKLKGADFVTWWPSEVDTSIRHGWFWRNAKQHVRSAEEVFNIYERSVGSNALLLLNVPPNRDGVFAARDTKVLLEVGKRIRATYGNKAAHLTADGFTFTFDKASTINRCVIQEDIASHGQRVEKHAIDAWIDGQWKEVSSAETVGYKRILRFPDVKTTKIRLRILAQRLTAKISNVSVHYDKTPLRSPSILRDRAGTVTIEGSGEIFYTLDSSTPTKKSTRYFSAFSLPKGGTVKAIGMSEEELSEVSTSRFDVAKEKWTIHTVSSQNKRSNEGAEKAIDGNPKTIWHSKWSGGTDKMPHCLSINFGEKLNLKGFTYLPRIGSAKGGILDQYRLEVSTDGQTWTKASEGRFDNIQNDPTLREIRFDKTYQNIRYMRFTGLHSIQNKPHSSAAELGVLTK